MKPWGSVNALFSSLGAMALRAHMNVGVQRHGSQERGLAVNSQGFTLGYRRDRPIRGSGRTVSKVMTAFG